MGKFIQCLDRNFNDVGVQKHTMFKTSGYRKITSVLVIDFDEETITATGKDLGRRNNYVFDWLITAKRYDSTVNYHATMEDAKLFVSLRIRKKICGLEEEICNLKQKLKWILEEK